ncbi:hypothetical protein ACVWYJ_007541 [Bradyrhizobium sp. USDA 4471]
MWFSIGSGLRAAQAIKIHKQQTDRTRALHQARGSGFDQDECSVKIRTVEMPRVADLILTP